MMRPVTSTSVATKGADEVAPVRGAEGTPGERDDRLAALCLEREGARINGIAVGWERPPVGANGQLENADEVERVQHVDVATVVSGDLRDVLALGQVDGVRCAA